MIYVHIPFCKKKCHYCNFHFSTNLRLKNYVIDAIIKEIELRNNELENRTLPSIYFGGGTPSILDIDDIQKILDHILKYFSFHQDIEITLEANPDDLNANFLKKLSSTSINRLSIGTQSFNEEELFFMNRAHTAQDAESSVKRSQDFGFQNISIDLIYGLPNSNQTIFTKNLQKIIELQVPHVSSYALTIEPKTLLNHWVNTKKISTPNEHFQNELFYQMSEFLKKNNFNHYEISNFGKETCHSKHTSAYWKQQEYLGIGPSAHSYNGKNKRSWNVANNALYIKNLSQNLLPKESELLSQKELYNEALMIGLRTIWGVDIIKLEKQYKAVFNENFHQSIQEKISTGMLIIENNYLKIPEHNWFYADGIASDLFVL